MQGWVLVLTNGVVQWSNFIQASHYRVATSLVDHFTNHTATALPIKIGYLLLVSVDAFVLWCSTTQLHCLYVQMVGPIAHRLYLGTLTTLATY